jgi:aromatic ring-cleaving dioxygenase
MSHITAGSVHAFFLFDVAEAIDLAALRVQLGARAGVAHLQDKAPGPRAGEIL